MKMDMDLFRDILIAIEEKPMNQDLDKSSLSDMIGKTPDEVLYHLHLLDDAGFMDSFTCNTIGNPDYRVQRLTFSGHEYLNNIRDNSVWQKTKETLSNVSSSASIDIIGSLATSIIKKSLGID